MNVVTTGQVALDAKRIIEEHGWIQGEARNDSGYCLVGALGEAKWQLENRTDSSPYGVATNTIKALQDETGYLLLAVWNDEPGRTREDVLATLDRIAERY